MKTIFKRMAAMATAVMMVASISSMGASALDNTYDLYISSTGAKTSKECEAGTSHEKGFITTILSIDSLASGAGVSYKTYVNNIYVGGLYKAITTKGTHPMDYSNYEIQDNKPITMVVTLQPKPSGINSYASGWVSGR